MMVSVAYVLYKGIEVLARTGELFFAVLFVLGMLGNLFVLFSGIVDMNHLLPVLEKGWKPVVTTALSESFMFPYGEAICFAMLLPYLNRPKTAFKVGGAAMIASGLALSLTISVEVAVLGADIASRSTFPLLSTISKVDIANFLQRLDAIAVFSLIISVFFKVAVFYYAAVMGSADLFKMADHRKLVLPIGIVILFSSMTIASGFSEHLEEGKFALRTVFIVFSLVIPVVLLLVSLIRRRFDVRLQKIDS
jgi:spore germination protein KB